MRNSAAAARSLQSCPTLCDPKKEKANTFSGADIEEGATIIVRKAQSPTKTFPACLEGEVSNSVAPTAQIKIHRD